MNTEAQPTGTPSPTPPIPARNRAQEIRSRVEQDEKVKSASKAILAVAILFIIGGSIMGMMAVNTANEALAHLSQFADDELLELENGVKILAGELRKQVKAEPTILFILNYMLSALYFVLFFWSKRSPFPAVVIALVVYCSVQVGNAIMDPTSLISGVVIKCIVIIVLGKGLSAALAQRKQQRERELQAQVS